MKLINTLLLAISLLSPLALAHGDHDTDLSEDEIPSGLSWEKAHMKYEHDIDDYDALTFFTLHDLNNKGYMDSKDILSLYGLLREEVVGKGDGMGTHDDSEVISEETKVSVVKQILDLLDANSDDRVTKEEYLNYAKKGGEFPNLGVGIGHSQDFEREYEIHHWNKYHKDQDPDVKVIHKEDVEHELLHHEHDIENLEKENYPTFDKIQLQEMIAVKNIPKKYLVN
ncbi:hypothetical protein WICPIJ_000281 [Wickerhamomyces pijperi]|uniref:EF-hand domain-containing protein n=1 Tax=Wickerhamomyces pijperi TaxID=599730 RepID=A0A9P8QCX5_WICPI|nr:hypothetical protein WICPIJ_000281 [Wickerhamomyces pijperi]